MTAIIREDEFYRYFDLVINLWPSELTLDAGGSDTLSVLDSSWLKTTYLAIRAELYENVEDWDLQVGTSLPSAIYKFLCIKSEGQFGTMLSRDSVDKTAVMDIMDQYQTWSVLRTETC